MPRFTKGGHVIETAHPTTVTQLRSAGWKETKAARTKRVKAEEAKPTGEKSTGTNETQIVVNPEPVTAPAETVAVSDNE